MSRTFSTLRFVLPLFWISNRSLIGDGYGAHPFPLSHRTTSADVSVGCLRLCVTRIGHPRSRGLSVSVTVPVGFRLSEEGGGGRGKVVWDRLRRVTVLSRPSVIRVLGLVMFDVPGRRDVMSRVVPFPIPTETPVYSGLGGVFGHGPTTLSFCLPSTRDY